MRVVHSSPDLIKLQSRSPARPTLLVGAAVLLGPMVATLVSGGALTPSRLVSAACLGLLGAALVAAGWPRLRRVELRLGDGSVRLGDAEPRPYGALPRLRLAVVPPEGPTGLARYGVLLDGAAVPVLLVADTNPEKALKDLARLREVVPWPVVAGWGLGERSPWTSVAPSADGPVAAPVQDDWVDGPTRRRIATTMLAGATGIGCIMAMEVRGRMVLGDDPSMLSVGLAALSLVAVMVLAAMIGTTDVRLHVDGERVVGERVRLGRTTRLREVPRSVVRSAHLVSPTGGTPRHLLLDTKAGPVALLCDPAEGSRALSLLRGCAE